MATPNDPAAQSSHSGGGENLPASNSNIHKLSPEFSSSTSKPQFNDHGKIDSIASNEYQGGVKLTADSDSSFMRYNDSDEDEPSKVDKLLGNGKVADILLWRDENKTFFCFLMFALLYHSLFIAGGTIISSIAKLLLLITMFLCGHRLLPLSICGFTIDGLSSSCFVVSEVDVRNTFLTMTFMWNELTQLTKTLAKGGDWSALLKVSIYLYVFKLIVLNYLRFTIGLAIVLLFTLCFVYEQYEEEIDGISTVIIKKATNALLSFTRNLPKPVSSIFSDLKPLAGKGSTPQTT